MFVVCGIVCNARGACDAVIGNWLENKFYTSIYMLFWINPKIIIIAHKRADHYAMNKYIIYANDGTCYKYV